MSWLSGFFRSILNPQNVADAVKVVATGVAAGANPGAIAIGATLTMVNDALLTPDNVERIRDELIKVRAVVDQGLAMLEDDVLSPDEAALLSSGIVAITKGEPLPPALAATAKAGG